MRPPELAIVIGATLIAVAIAWRVVNATRARRRIRRLLQSEDPVARVHGLDILSERGLRSQARTLVRMSTAETNPDVRAALLTAIARTQWEPVNHAALVELRAWARLRAAEVPAEATGVPAAPVEEVAPPRTQRENRPLRASRPTRDRSLVDRLERVLGEPVFAVRLEWADGSIEVDVQTQEEMHCV